MCLPKKLYEALKFTKDFGFAVISIVTALLMAFGIADNTVSIVALCISSFCQLIVIFINTCAKNHWKSKAEDGTEVEIEKIEIEEMK